MRWKDILLLSRFSRVRLCATPWTAAYQASPSMGFSKQEHWSRLPFPSPLALPIFEHHVNLFMQCVNIHVWIISFNSVRLIYIIKCAGFYSFSFLYSVHLHEYSTTYFSILMLMDIWSFSKSGHFEQLSIFHPGLLMHICVCFSDIWNCWILVWAFGEPRSLHQVF